MKILILLLISFNAFSSVKVKQSHGVQISCIDFEKSFIGDSDYKVCEYKLIKSEIRSCSLTLSPGRASFSTTSAVDCAIFDEVRRNVK